MSSVYDTIDGATRSSKTTLAGTAVVSFRETTLLLLVSRTASGRIDSNVFDCSVAKSKLSFSKFKSSSIRRTSITV